MHLQSVFLVLLLITLQLTNVFCEVSPENHTNKEAEQAKTSPKNVPVINLNKTVAKPVGNNSSSISHEIIDDNKTAVTAIPKLPHGSDDLMQSGALQRAFFVLLGGTVLLLLFLGFRMYRLQKGGIKPNVMVRKYGVLAHRRDVEMLPLPLDEEDDDDTVFEVNNRIESHS